MPFITITGSPKPDRPSGHRVRVCPSCGTTDYASKLLDYYGSYSQGTWGDDVQRVCRHCGRIGATSEFPVVREDYR